MTGRWSSPSDLGVVSALVAATVIALLVPATPEPVGWILGVPFLVLYPGYAVVSALFPVDPAASRTSPDYPGGAPGWATRFGLALLTSAIVVATIGIVLLWTVGIDLVPVVVSVGVFTLVALAAASVRRRAHPTEERANPLAGGFASFRPNGSRLQAIAIVLAIAALAGTVAYAGATTPPSEQFTEFSVLTENENGTLVAANYSDRFVAGQGHPLHFAITNHEGETTNYQVVVLYQAVSRGGTVTHEERIDQFGVQVPASERVVVERQIAPTRWNEGVRLRFLLYKGSVPKDPGVGNADLSLHIWTNVVEG